MFAPSQHDVRRFFCEAWRKDREGLALEALLERRGQRRAAITVLAVEIILDHQGAGARRPI